MTAEPPLRCAVLVESEPHFAEVGEDRQNWRLLHANCDIAEARVHAAKWAAAHEGFKAAIMLYDDHVEGAMQVAWAKPA